MQRTGVIQRAAYTCNNDRTADNVLVARNDHVAYNISGVVVCVPILGDAVRRSGGSSFDQHTQTEAHAQLYGRLSRRDFAGACYKEPIFEKRRPGRVQTAMLCWKVSSVRPLPNGRLPA